MVGMNPIRVGDMNGNSPSRCEQVKPGANVTILQQLCDSARITTRLANNLSGISPAINDLPLRDLAS
jgi:hypothetical protein